jgi:dTDP-4-dehydrorhamnose 3,5-epimerase
LWNDPEIGIEWPKDITPQLSSKDSAAKTLAQFDRALLPIFSSTR